MDTILVTRVARTTSRQVLLIDLANCFRKIRPAAGMRLGNIDCLHTSLGQKLVKSGYFASITSLGAI